MRFRLFIFAFVLFAFAGLAADLSGNLVANGDFEQMGADGKIPGWQTSPRVTLGGKAGGNRWLVVDRANAVQSIKLKPDYWQVKLTLKMRSRGVVCGKEGWQNARLTMSFHDANGKMVGGWPNVFSMNGTHDWTELERMYQIPPNAAVLHIGAAVLGPAGVAEFDDISFVVSRLRSQEKDDEPFPGKGTNFWGMNDAWRVKTPTRERICLNGLWGFRPFVAGDKAIFPPKSNDCWGWFAVPGCWPSSNYEEQAGQPFVLSPWIAERVEMGKVDQAWYRRNFTAPENWDGRRVFLDFTLLQTHATVFVDGRKAGEIWFPGGNFEISEFVRPGRKQELALLVTARPLEKEAHVFMAPDRIISQKAKLQNRGIPGDVYLFSAPSHLGVEDVHVQTSYREKSIAFSVGMRSGNGVKYKLRARVLEQGREVKVFESELSEGAGRLTFGGSWKQPKLWDTDTPNNLYKAIVSVHDQSGYLLDEMEPVEFGFREFWIDGRDFYLNGSPIHLRALHCGTMGYGAELTNRKSAGNTMAQMKRYGFNFFITGNYNFSPGAVSYMDGLLDAADRSGVLCSFSLPHIKDFGMKLDKPEQAKRYRELCDWLVRRVQNHPAVVLYAMNHNATGYYGDQNPLKMDGIYQPEAFSEKITYKGGGNRFANRWQATLAAKIAEDLDPTRPVYHHQSGNLGAMHTVNIYLNWAPPQERDDWLSHWAEEGEKPMFFVEWGLPHISTWSSYRGPRFIWRTKAFQSIWDSEFAASFLGERAYDMTEAKCKSLEHEEGLWATGEPFYWSHLLRHLRGTEECHLEINSMFASRNWRSHRAHGVSAMLPWDQGELWKRVKPVEKTEVPWREMNLKQPGIVSKWEGDGSQIIYSPMEKDAFEPSSLGQVFLRWNMPLCAFVGGRKGAFTEKSHNVFPGERLAKQLIVLNDTRREQRCRATWDSPFGSGEKTVVIPPGGQVRIGVKLKIPKNAKVGEALLTAKFEFDEGSLQADEFAFHVLERTSAPSIPKGEIALFDPVGETGKLLKSLDVRFHEVDADSTLEGVKVLLIGREALSGTVVFPALRKLREGLKILVFEQDAATLRDRLGFRINIQGLRRVSMRTASHPALAGIVGENLRDWRGESTLTPPFLENLQDVETHDPRWDWCGFRNTRVWRCGNRGNVASVLIEKPPCGRWLPLLDGGFDLQYAPLLEGEIGAGRIIFCQLDLTGRSQPDPVVGRLCLNLIHYLHGAPKAKSFPVSVAGDERLRQVVAALGVRVGKATGTTVVGSGVENLAEIKTRLEKGGAVLALGLALPEVKQLLPDAELKVGEWNSCLLKLDSPVFAGISNAETHWRTRLNYAAFKEGAMLYEGKVGKGQLVVCQVAPWMLDAEAKPYLRTSERRNFFLLSRLLANLGADFSSPLPELLASAPRQTEQSLDKDWRGKVDKENVGEREGWFKSDADDSLWKPIEVGTTFESQRAELSEYDGVFWYRLRFDVPESLRKAGPQTLFIGAIDDESRIWLNGEFLGEVNPKTHPKNYWSFPRQFSLKKGQLLPGGNVLAVQVKDTYRSGGILGKPRLFVPALWLKSHYVQTPKAGDDPYRYYRW